MMHLVVQEITSYHAAVPMTLKASLDCLSLAWTWTGHGRTKMLENIRFSNFLGLGWAWSGQSTVKKHRKAIKPVGFPTFLTKKVGQP